MIDIANHSVRPYIFKDGPKIIKTKSPTQGMLKKFMSIETLSSDDSEDLLQVIEDIFKSILYSSDYHYVEEVPLQIQIQILNEYFEHHTSQLNDKIPYPGSREH